jgi:hypothetical protein
LIENSGTGQAKKIISGIAAYVEAPMSDYNQQTRPALPERPNSRNNKDKAGQAYENQQSLDKVHVHTPF